MLLIGLLAYRDPGELVASTVQQAQEYGDGTRIAPERGRAVSPCDQKILTSLVAYLHQPVCVGCFVDLVKVTDVCPPAFAPAANQFAYCIG